MKTPLALALVAPMVLVAACAEARPYTRNVAIVVYENAQPLDWTGPYEVYHDAASFGTANGEPAFNVYIVSKTKEPVNAQGLRIVPDYSIANAPKPDIVVFPGGPSSNVTEDPEFFAWAKKVSLEAEIAQSVCTGASVLGKAGMLDGLEVTTFHGAIDGLQKRYPKAMVKRGRRFVDNGQVVTTAGISAGIDGSLHVVARLLGRRTADKVATYMEYSWVPEASLAGGYSYLNPSADEAMRLNQNADIQYESRNYVEAETIYRALTEQQPKDPMVWYRLGVALRAQEKHAEAAAAFERSGADANEHMAGYHLYDAAVQYAKAGRKEDAIRTLETAFARGFRDRLQAANEPALVGIVADARVKRLLAENASQAAR